MEEDFFTWYKSFGILQKIPEFSREDFERYGFLTEDVKLYFKGQNLHHEGFRAFNKDGSFSLATVGPCLLGGQEYFVWSYDYPDDYSGSEEDIVREFNKNHSGKQRDLPPVHINDLSELPDEYEVYDDHFDCNDNDLIEIKFSDYTIHGNGMYGMSERFHWYYPTYRDKSITHKLTICGVITILERFFGIQQPTLDQFLFTIRKNYAPTGI